MACSLRFWRGTAKLLKILLTSGGPGLARLCVATPALSAVLVFAELASTDLQQRGDEYSFGFGGSKGTQYVDFLANDLAPAIEARYRVCNRPEARGVAGASLSGLISSFAAFEKPARLLYGKRAQRFCDRGARRLQLVCVYGKRHAVSIKHRRRDSNRSSSRPRRPRGVMLDLLNLLRVGARAGVCLCWCSYRSGCAQMAWVSASK